MPFTLSHAAAVLPLRRTRFPWSALVIGTFGPDFEYFLRMSAVSRDWHYYPDVLIYCLPFTALAYFLYHVWIERPAIGLLPESFQQRLNPRPNPFPKSIGQLVMLIAALAVGIASHLAWDAFTHPYSWPWQHIAALRHSVALPHDRRIFGYAIAQNLSSVGGLILLAYFVYRWHVKTPPTYPVLPRPSPSVRYLLCLMIPVVAIGCSVWRTWLLLGPPQPHVNRNLWVVTCAINVIAWFLWELTAYGVVMTLAGKTKGAQS